MNLKLITDKDLIVFLVVKGFEIKNIEKEKNRNRSLVYFKKTRELEKTILKFVNKTETINIGEYQAADKMVKTLLCMQKFDK